MTVPRRQPGPTAASIRTPDRIRRQRRQCEDLIEASGSDFTAVYYAVYHLRSLLEDHPATAAPPTLAVLEKLLTREDFARQRQGLFLVRQAALALVTVMVRNEETTKEADTVSRLARESLHRVLAVSWGHGHRAVAESLLATLAGAD